MELMNYRVSFRPQGEKLISTGTFVARDNRITLSKQVNLGIFVRKEKLFLTFTLQDVAAVRPGEMRGYSSMIFDLKNGQSVDISLPKKKIAAITEEIRQINA